MKRKNRIIKATSFLMLCLFFLCVSTSASAQQKTVTGTVTNDRNQTLPGVSVVIKGTIEGTVTSIDGNYTIVGASSEDVLLFSYIGMAPQEIAIGGQSSINVTLSPNDIGLDEVVVVGFGTQKKATLSGSIETIDSEVFLDRAVTNPALSLQGQTPGLVITRTSSQPGNEGLNMQIRGATSVNGGEPFIVIDGSPIIDNDAFYNMNSNDIESISVLKDGAASIYGSRAANGVILVTTKKGTGEMKVEVSSNMRINTVGIAPPASTMEEFATIWLAATDQDLAYDPSTVNYNRWIDRELLLRYQQGEPGVYPDLYTDSMYMSQEDGRFFDHMFGPSVSNQQNISISGSNDKRNYRISGQYAEDRGLLKPAYDGKKQYNFRTNYNINVNSWFKIETGMSYTHADLEGPSTGLNASVISHDPPFWPPTNPAGQWYATFGGWTDRNPVAATTDGGKTFNTSDQLKINAAATFQVFDGLSIRGTASVDRAFYSKESYATTVLCYDWWGGDGANPINPVSYYEQEGRDLTYQMYGGFANYNKTLGAHSFSAMIGSTAELKEGNRLYGHRLNFEDQGVYNINVASGENQTNEGDAWHWGIYSYLGRFNYDYANKYLLELSGRSDGSSRFAMGHKWSSFGNASLGWVLSEEDFLSSVSFISFMKLRASYGETGNQQGNGIGYYDYVSTMEAGTALFGQQKALKNAARVNGITSNTRTWERVEMTNAGLDFKLLDSKIYGSFDYFEKKNKGMLIDGYYPSVLGGAAPKSNSGELHTKGWEAVMGHRDTKGDFSYNVTFTLANTTNELVHMEGVNTFVAGKNENVQGYPLNSFFLYETDGYFKNEDEIIAYYDQVGEGGEIPQSKLLENGSYSNLTQRLRPGDIRKVDQDESGNITSAGNIDDMNSDVVYKGDAAPHYNYGLNLSLKYKKFDLTTFFQGVWLQNVVRTGHMAYPFAAIWSNQRTSFNGKTWTPDNTGADYPRLTINNNRAAWNWRNNDFMMVNNRYIRLKTLVVGYNFKVKNVEKIRVFFSGNDLLEFTSLKEGYDPEYGESTSSAYPFSRTYSFGLNVTF